MNQLVNPAVSINSIEIAKMVGKRHDNVRRTITTLTQNGVITSPQIEVIEEINNLQIPVQRDVFVFSGERGKRDSIIVVAQLYPEFTARLVDRWQELEKANVNPKQLSRMDILKLAMESEQRAIDAEEKLAIAAPKVQFVDSYVNSSGSLGFREACKLLHIKENAFRQFLVEQEIMYLLAGKLTPYAQHIDAGRFTVKTGENQTNGHAFTQNKFTPKGIQWIAGLWAAHLVEGGEK